MDKSEYLKLKQDLNRLHRLQYDKKKQRKAVIEHISFMQKRIYKNSVMSPEGHPGARYVPWSAIQYMPKALKSLSKIQKQLNSNNKKIQALQQRLITEKVRLHISKAIDRAFSQQSKVTNRDIVEKIFRLQGLFLHDNNEISNRKGKLVGWYGDDAKYNSKGLFEFTCKPVQSINFISIDLKIDGLQIK